MLTSSSAAAIAASSSVIGSPAWMLRASTIRPETGSGLRARTSLRLGEPVRQVLERRADQLTYRRAGIRVGKPLRPVPEHRVDQLTYRRAEIRVCIERDVGEREAAGHDRVAARQLCVEPCAPVARDR